MTRLPRNFLLMGAIGAGLLSLPMKWMTIQNAQIQGGFGGLFNSLGGMTVNVTGLNGSVTVLVETPLWFIVCIAIIANGLQLLDGSKSLVIPRIAQLATALIAFAWIGLALVIGIFSAKATLAIGALLGLASAAIPLVCLFMPPAVSERPKSTETHTISD